MNTRSGPRLGHARDRGQRANNLTTKGNRAEPPTQRRYCRGSGQDASGLGNSIEVAPTISRDSPPLRSPHGVLHPVTDLQSCLTFAFALVRRPGSNRQTEVTPSRAPLSGPLSSLRTPRALARRPLEFHRARASRHSAGLTRAVTPYCARNGLLPAMSLRLYRAPQMLDEGRVPAPTRGLPRAVGVDATARFPGLTTRAATTALEVLLDEPRRQ